MWDHRALNLWDPTPPLSAGQTAAAGEDPSRGPRRGLAGVGKPPVHRVGRGEASVEQ